MSGKKTLFTLPTGKFLFLWAQALRSSYNWSEFITLVENDNGVHGIAKPHDDYFNSKSGKDAMAAQFVLYKDWMDNMGTPLSAKASLTDKKLYDIVRSYFYSEKCLAKCNALRANKNLNPRPPKPFGWDGRMGKKKGGGGPKVDWDKRNALFAGLTTKK